MKKQRKWFVILSVILALSIITGTSPYFSKAEESGSDAASGQQQAASADAGSAAEPAGAAADPAGVSAGAEAGAGAAGNGIALPKPSLYPITATKKVAENGRYQLFIDDKTGNIRIVNKETNTEWLGSPQVDRRTLPNNKKFMDSPVHIRYTDGVDTVQTYTLKDKETKLTIKSIDQGVREEFNLAKLKLSFALEIRLNEDGIEAAIPFDSLKEEGKSRFVSLEPLPFLNAAQESDDGALFLPDGSGTLIKYRTNHPKYYAGYSEPVYGPDYAYLTQTNDQIDQMWRHEMPPREFIAMPVFGSYKNKAGYLGIIEQGEFDAKINGTPSGIRNIQMYRASAEFVYRNNDVIFIGSSGDIPLFQGAMIEGDRKIKYVLLEGDEANYVGMAHAYRSYLTGELGIKPAENTSLPLNVTLLGGILRDEVIGSTFIKMTTFDQARSIIDAYAKKGVKNLQLTLEGWSKDGLYGDQPDHFPVAKQLGGSSDLEDLASYAKKQGVTLYLKANYVRPFSKSDGMSKSKDAIRGLDREVLTSFNYWVSNKYSNRNEAFYYMKPDRVYDKHAAKELEDYADLGVAGIDFQYVGDTLYSDQDTKHLFNREQSAGVWVKALDAYRKKVGKTAVDYGFGYTLGHVDQINNMPMDSSHFVVTDETVPFYQIAVHGLIPYTAKPSNLRDDSQTEFLRALEYGAMPSYELTYAPTSELQRTMEDRLFSSHFSYWLEPSVKEYETFKELNDQVADQPIVNHEQLDRHLFRTTYGNGTQVIVNYDTSAATVDGQTIEGLGYAIVKGGS